jgi:DNA polymerase I
MKSKEGIPTNATYLFFNTFMNCVNEYNPDHVIFCFDTPVKTEKHKILQDYKSNRKEMDNDLKTQFPIIKEIISYMQIEQIEIDGMEADDVIASITNQVSNESHVKILSADKDLFQLVSSNVSIIKTNKLGKFDEVNSSNFKDKYFSIEPNQVPDFKALVGDSSDNIKGVPGLGPKTAIKLIEEFNSIENLVYNKSKIPEKLLAKIEPNIEDLILYKKITLINPIQEVKFNNFPFSPNNLLNNETLYILNKLDLKRLIKKMEGKNDKK